IRAWRRNSHHARTPSEFMYVTWAVSNTTRPTIAGRSSSNRVASVKSPCSTTGIPSPSLTTCHWVSRASTARARSSGLSNATPTTVLPSRGWGPTALPRIWIGAAPPGAADLDRRVALGRDRDLEHLALGHRLADHQPHAVDRQVRHRGVDLRAGE